MNRYTTYHYDLSPECEEGKTIRKAGGNNILLYITYKETTQKTAKRKTRALYLDVEGKSFESESGKEGKIKTTEEQKKVIINMLNAIKKSQEAKAKANISIFLRITQEMTKGRKDA